MRVHKSNDGLHVYAVAGTYVVMLGFNMPEADCQGLLGYSIHRVDHTEDEAYYLEGMKAFEATDPGLPPGSQYSTRDHPIQSFQWADYTAKPGHQYTYTITALKGTPAARGLNEALEEFVRSCVPGTHALRVAAYEFNYVPFLELLKETLDRGVDVKIVYDARSEKPGDRNREAVQTAGLEGVSAMRTQPASYISHNKFIVKLEDEEPRAVWTGGTNFSENGIFGHSNVAHLVEDAAIANLFFNYWNALSGDPDMETLKAEVENLTPGLPSPPPDGTSVIFSPRSGLDALTWYAQLAKSASDGLFMTFAFGMNDLFKDVYANGKSPFRLALMESAVRAMKDGPKRNAELQKIQDLRNMPENTFAIDDFIRSNELDGWVKERLSGLSTNVKYVHNKFMLVDPLGDDPVVIAGSANFSDASTTENDENMLIVRGNLRVADIYLGEFMRLYSHHAFRESLKWRNPDEPVKPLRIDDWWSDYFGDTEQSTRRRFFARVPD